MREGQSGQWDLSLCLYLLCSLLQTVVGGWPRSLHFPSICVICTWPMEGIGRKWKTRRNRQAKVSLPISLSAKGRKISELTDVPSTAPAFPWWPQPLHSDTTASILLSFPTDRWKKLMLLEGGLLCCPQFGFAAFLLPMKAVLYINFPLLFMLGVTAFLVGT